MPNGTPNPADRAVDAMLREYEVLRAEIALYHQQQNQSFNFTILGMFAAASAFYALHGSSFPDADLFRRLLLLGFSLFAIINGFAFADRSFRVKRIARYLHSYLRPKLIALLDNRHVWHWELFKKASHRMAKGWDRALTLALDWFRLAFFFLAALVSWILYFLEASAGGTLPEKILLALNGAALLVFLVAWWRIQETTGATSDARLNEEVDRLSAEQTGKGEAG